VQFRRQYQRGNTARGTEAPAVEPAIAAAVEA